MITYFIIFLISTACVFIAMQILHLTKGLLDRAYRFFLLASIVLLVLMAIKVLNVGEVIDFKVDYYQYFELAFALLFLDGLLSMRRVVRELEPELKKKRKK